MVVLTLQQVLVLDAVLLVGNDHSRIEHPDTEIAVQQREMTGVKEETERKGVELELLHGERIQRHECDKAEHRNIEPPSNHLEVDPLPVGSQQQGVLAEAESAKQNEIVVLLVEPPFR